jgi:hypothetical protein
VAGANRKFSRCAAAPQKHRIDSSTNGPHTKDVMMMSTPEPFLSAEISYRQQRAVAQVRRVARAAATGCRAGRP